MSSVYLCGFMGCGKTTVGIKLSQFMYCDFIDLDRYIEKVENKTIVEIFNEYGETYFRALEKTAIANLATKNSVIATGGGALTIKENADIAKSLGSVVFINTPFDVCYNRIKGDINRPLAISKTEEQLKELYEKRQLLYMQNSHVAVQGIGTPANISKAIMKAIRTI